MLYWADTLEKNGGVRGVIEAREWALGGGGGEGGVAQFARKIARARRADMWICTGDETGYTQMQ